MCLFRHVRVLLLFIFCDFTSSSKNYFWCVFLCRLCVLYHPAVCLQCNVLCFTSNPSPSSPCAPPYLSPMEMRRGQGIWGEEHREAALHNLKGILMNQHSRTRYSHDNRPQTNSCIWSPLALWLWKCCVYVRERELVVVFVFGVQ